MYTFSGLEGGFVSDDTLRYYGARSQAASLLITEFHYVSPSGGPCYQTSYPVQLGIYSDDHIEGERKLAAALQKDGNKAILQLHHGGIAASGRALKGEEVLAPSALDFSFLPYPVRELTDEEILEIIKDFGRAVKRAVQAGFQEWKSMVPTTICCSNSFLAHPMFVRTDGAELWKTYGLSFGGSRGSEACCGHVCARRFYYWLSD